MNAIMAFNQLVQMYPQYKKFMVKNGYDLVLRKTFEMNIQYFEPNHYSGLFLNAPEIFFLVKLESSVYAKFEQIDESFAKSVFSQGPFKFRKVSSPRRNLLASQPLEEGKDEKTNRKNQQL